MEMKYNGRITAFILVLIANCVYITYYFLRDGYISTIELVGLPIMLLIAWWSGKQYDTIKLLEEKDELKSKELQKRNNLFQTVFEKVPIGIAILDKNGTPVVSNAKLQEILGYTGRSYRPLSFGKKIFS